VLSLIQTEVKGNDRLHFYQINESMRENKIKAADRSDIRYAADDEVRRSRTLGCGNVIAAETCLESGLCVGVFQRERIECYRPCL